MNRPVIQTWYTPQMTGTIGHGLSYCRNTTTWTCTVQLASFPGPRPVHLTSTGSWARAWGWGYSTVLCKPVVTYSQLLATHLRFIHSVLNNPRSLRCIAQLLYWDGVVGQIYFSQWIDDSLYESSYFVVYKNNVICIHCCDKVTPVLHTGSPQQYTRFPN